MSETSEEWLARNARELEFPVPKEVDSGPMLTAREEVLKAQSSTVQGSRGAGRWDVVLSSSDRNHEVVLAAYPDATYVGACDCEDFQHRDRAEGCKHLCFVRVKEAMGDVKVPDVSQVSFDLSPQQPPEPDVIDAEVKEVEDTEDVPDPGQPNQNGKQPPQRPDGFATPLPDVPGEFVMEMGGEKYIRRAGYARLGRQAGLSHSVELAHGKAFPKDQVVMKATVTDAEGNQWQDWGTAGPAEKEDMSNADVNLLELAATRALTRAYAWATGEGLTAVAEVNPEAER